MADEYCHVSDLKPGTHGHTLKLKVVNCNTIVEKMCSDRTKIRVAEALVGDETGCIILNPINEQIETVTPGSSIIVRNARIDMVRGHMRLTVDRWGSIETAAERHQWEVFENENVSLTEYTQVKIR